MSRQVKDDQIRIKLLHKHLVQKINQHNFNSSNFCNISNPNLFENNGRIDFADFLLNNEKKYLLQNLQSQQISSHTNQQSKQSYHQIQFKYHPKRKLRIEVGENYTFANSNSNTNRIEDYLQQKSKIQKIQKNDDQFMYSQDIDNKCRNRQSISQRQSTKQQKEKQKQFYRKFQTESVKNFTQKSVTSTQQNQNEIIYQKKLEEEMLIKISQQSKLIVKLQQKIYYFEDFCKRLMKSSEINDRKITILQTELKKNMLFNEQLSHKLTNKQKQLQSFKQFYQQQKRNYLRQRKMNKKNEQDLKDKEQIRIKEQLQARKSKLNSKKICNSTQTESNNEKISILQNQNFFLKAQLQRILLINNKVQTMNQILSKQVKELNRNIFVLQKQIQDSICLKYIDNIARIKNLQYPHFR